MNTFYLFSVVNCTVTAVSSSRNVSALREAEEEAQKEQQTLQPAAKCFPDLNVSGLWAGDEDLLNTPTYLVKGFM